MASCKLCSALPIKLYYRLPKLTFSCSWSYFWRKLSRLVIRYDITLHWWTISNWVKVYKRIRNLVKILDVIRKMLGRWMQAKRRNRCIYWLIINLCFLHHLKLSAWCLWKRSSDWSYWNVLWRFRRISSKSINFYNLRTTSWDGRLFIWTWFR